MRLCGWLRLGGFLLGPDGHVESPRAASYPGVAQRYTTGWVLTPEAATAGHRSPTSTGARQQSCIRHTTGRAWSDHPTRGARKHVPACLPGATVVLTLASGKRLLSSSSCDDNNPNEGVSRPGGATRRTERIHSRTRSTPKTRPPTCQGRWEAGANGASPTRSTRGGHDLTGMASWLQCLATGSSIAMEPRSRLRSDILWVAVLDCVGWLEACQTPPAWCSSIRHLGPVRMLRPSDPDLAGSTDSQLNVRVTNVAMHRLRSVSMAPAYRYDDQEIEVSRSSAACLRLGGVLRAARLGPDLLWPTPKQRPRPLASSCGTPTFECHACGPSGCQATPCSPGSRAAGGPASGQPPRCHPTST